MQTGLTDGILNQVSFTPGVQTPVSDYESQQTCLKNPSFYGYHNVKQWPLSPASTVSDRSDHSDQSSFSDVPSQSSQSSLSEQSTGSRDPSPVVSPLAQRGQGLDGTGYEGSRLTPSVASSRASEQHVKPFSKPQGAVANYRTKPHDEVQQCPSLANYAQDVSHSAAKLPYRSRHESVSEPSQPTSCANTYTRATTKPEQQSADVNVESSCSEGSTEISVPRCFPRIFNAYSGIPSSRCGSTTSPQAQQINQRRRPVNSAVPPPRLRRDTDNTDAIVKMIVIFCTNLIQSIWPVDSVSASCNATSQSAGTVLPLQVFITETLRRSKTSYSTLQIALYYLILLRQCLPELSNPGQKSQSGCRAMLCGRRMFLTALILASKYLQDRNYSARAWSKISGLPMKEINDNERRYLRFVGWDLHVPKEAFENWSKIVLAICRLSTGQDPASKDFDHQPPSPGTGPIGQTSTKSQLQDMCPTENLQVVRSWWIFNLHSLCTDVVRCPLKTDRYVSAIPQLKTTTGLPRPLFENKLPEHAFNYARDQEESTSASSLSRSSSIECLVNKPPPSIVTHPSTQRIMPPPPPVLSNLPTPQTTPRFDAGSPWKGMPSRSSSRCRDSTSLLRSIDRMCPMANAEKFPVSRCAPQMPGSARFSQDCKTSLAQPSPGAWSSQSFRARFALQGADQSLTSSPESVISDLSSLSGFVGRSRTSSFSSTSSLSMMSQSSIMASDAERCEGFKRQLNSLDAQIVPRVQDWTDSALSREPERHASQEIPRPQTAFQTSIPRSTCSEDQARLQAVDTDTESVVDEGYWSSDHAQGKRQERRRQAAAQALAQLQQHQCEQQMNALRHKLAFKPAFSRPALTRSNTQVFNPVDQSAAASQQTLKRSRSESFDKASETCPADLSSYHTNFARAKDVQQSSQPWAAPKQPIQCASQDANKRIAVQSAAAARASLDLRKEAGEWFKHHHQRAHQKPSDANVEAVFGSGSLWQQHSAPLQEIHV